MTTRTSTFGMSIGRAIGYTRAASVHAGSVAITYTGNFGADVATGANAAYVEHSARLAALRLATAGARPTSIAITPRRVRATA